MSRIRVIGGGLAGPEAALMAARLGCEVDLYEMRAVVDGTLRSTPAHQTADFAELVCSNSLKSESREHRALAAEAGNAAGRVRPARVCGCERRARWARPGGRPGGILPPGGERHRAGKPHYCPSRRSDHARPRPDHHRRHWPTHLGASVRGNCPADRQRTSLPFTTPSAPSWKPTPLTWSGSTLLPATTRAPPITLTAP